jgi:uncharacterized glyoxalase superfamily protein PhnB/DNA-binding XRE family transcriptional regulator
MDDKAAGERVKRARDRRAWTQEQLALAADLSVRTVQRAEEGAMSAETLSALAGALDVEVSTLTGPPPEPRITPVLFYENAKTLDWLVEAFGFEAKMRIPDPEGRILHAELTLGDARIMIGSPYPARHWTTPSQAGARTQCVYVMTSDADAHCARARAAGARILVEPETIHGDRRYLAEDPEGHHWWFATALGA